MGMNNPTHKEDVAELQALVQLCPVMNRHLRHHLRNSLAVILLAIENGQTHHALTATNHMIADLEEVGL